jgi:hypothetical protein
VTTHLPALTATCPFCSSSVSESALGKLGLTREELTKLAEHARDQTFGKVIRLAEILIHKIEPDRLNPELFMKNTLAEILQAVANQDSASKTILHEMMKMVGSQNADFQRMVNEIFDDFRDVKQKILGPGIGKVGENISIKEFKAVMPSDDFSDHKADSHGTDILAYVTEDGQVVGKVAISVKYSTNWEKGYLRQVQKNMEQECTRFAILVTRSLPADSLNDKVQLKATSNGGVIILAKPEYAPVTYCGLRLAVISSHEAELASRNVQCRVQEQNRIFKALTDWLTGEKFKLSIASMEQITNLSRETDTVTENLLTYNQRTINGIQKIQKELRQSLSQIEGSLLDLRSQLEAENTLQESGNLENINEKGE